MPHPLFLLAKLFQGTKATHGIRAAHGAHASKHGSDGKKVKELVDDVKELKPEKKDDTGTEK